MYNINNLHRTITICKNRRVPYDFSTAVHVDKNLHSAKLNVAVIIVIIVCITIIMAIVSSVQEKLSETGDVEWGRMVLRELVYTNAHLYGV